MSFELRFSTSNAAFDPEDGDPCGEVARILRLAAEGASFGVTSKTIMDINGNTIGEWNFDNDNDGS